MFKKSMSLVGVLTFLMVATSVLAAKKPFDVRVSFKGTETANQVEFDVVVSDSTTKAEVFAPKVITTWGEPAKANSMDKEGREFSFSVAFDKGGKAATYELIVTKNGKEIQKENGTFSRK
jgi:hypothetical protein